MIPEKKGMNTKQHILQVSLIVIAAQLLIGFGALAQNEAGNSQGLNITLEGLKRQIVAGENLGLRIVISNATQRIQVAPPQPFAFLNLIVQQNGVNVPYQIKRSLQLFGDIAIEANSAITINEDLSTWFPLGLSAGEFSLSLDYIFNRADRSLALRSNPVPITVLPRSQEQEAQYQAFVGIFSAPIQAATQFLATYPDSMFEPRVRLELAKRYLATGDFDSANRALEEISTLASATALEIDLKHYFSARTLKAQGNLLEAILEAEQCPALWVINETQYWKNEFDKQLAAQVRLKPEALEVSPGILTAFVRLPEGYPVSGITSATCDRAKPERMPALHRPGMPNDDGTEMIIKFRRQDIEEALAQVGQSIDTHFVVRGVWKGAAETNFFEGAASIKKIVGAKSK